MTPDSPPVNLASLKPNPLSEDDFERFWKTEPWDEVVPRGFLSDFVLASRGIETPTNFTLWSGLFVVSSALKRDAWLRWYGSTFVPNIFVIIVGPPRILAKSTAVNYAESKILSEFHNVYPDRMMQERKRINIVRKSTPEALTLALVPEEKAWIEDRTRYVLDRGSQVCLIISELSTFLGKQKYNNGLIDRLTKLYDCMDKDDELTISRGRIDFHNIYTTMFGATTPDGLLSSIPEEAFGSGFMSRLIIVNGDAPTRSFSIPREVVKKSGKPFDWPLELQRRLAWIAQKSMGEFDFLPETREIYDAWYHPFKMTFAKRYKAHDKELLMKSRYDTHLCKLMILLRAQSYDHRMDDPEARLLRPEDFYLAKAILDRTYSENFESVEEVVVSSPKEKWTRRVVKLIKEKGGEVTKDWLFPRLSPYKCYASDLREILHQLSEEGKIEILAADGKKRSFASSDGKERYIWKGKEITINGLSQSYIPNPGEQDEENVSGAGFGEGGE